MPRWGMVIDLNACTGCQGCTVACAVENNIAPPLAEEEELSRPFTWMRVLAEHSDEDADTPIELLPRPCMHCDEPPCIKVCPVDATNIDSEGIVRQIFARCIGCRYCTTACPYTVRYFNWHTPVWPQPMEQSLNPDVSIRPAGVVEKCTFCHHRLQRARDRAAAEGRQLLPGEYTPACVEACPAKAMTFGDLEDPDSEVSRRARGRRAYRLLEQLGTRPKVVYLQRGD